MVELLRYRLTDRPTDIRPVDRPTVPHSVAVRPLPDRPTDSPDPSSAIDFESYLVNAVTYFGQAYLSLCHSGIYLFVFCPVKLVIHEICMHGIARNVRLPPPADVGWGGEGGRCCCGHRSCSPIIPLSMVMKLVNPKIQKSPTSVPKVMHFALPLCGLVALIVLVDSLIIAQ